MLAALSIRDIVLIDKLDLGLGHGLCTLTGETGAGKSILLDALGLAIGGRADGGLVAQGADKGSVTAVFDLRPGHAVFKLLSDNEIEVEEGVILRRVQARDGKTRAFINDQPVSVSLLRAVGDLLIEVHGQHDERGLLDEAGHRDLLDAIGALATPAANVRRNWEALSEARTALSAHRTALARAAAERDYLAHSVAELEALDPQEGEEDRLAEQRTLMMHSEKISVEIEEAENALSGDQGLEARVNLALRRLERAKDQAAGHLDEVIAALDRTLNEAADARDLLARAVRALEFDPSALEEAETRLFALRAAARKFDVSVDRLPELRERMRADLAGIEAGEGRTKALEKAVAEAEASYAASAGALSDARLKAAIRLDKSVASELKPLKLDKATFRTQVTQVALEKAGPDGIDKVAFLISTNPGAPLGPLIKIASGGELSRFVLALKVSLASAGAASTLIFDEVDAGVGGAVAEAVGTRLAELARDLQVLVVTHSPQVAARAGRHIRISKSAAGRAGKGAKKLDALTTQVEVLDDAARREEIARMLAGATVTDAARAAADQLIGGARV
ncbi:MAG: DNA repair protein RecN [Parvibaculum sp.]